VALAIFHLSHSREGRGGRKVESTNPLLYLSGRIITTIGQGKKGIISVSCSSSKLSSRLRRGRERERGEEKVIDQLILSFCSCTASSLSQMRRGEKKEKKKEKESQGMLPPSLIGGEEERE